MLYWVTFCPFPLPSPSPHTCLYLPYLPYCYLSGLFIYLSPLPTYSCPILPIFFLPSLTSLSYFPPFSYSIFFYFFFPFLPPFPITVHLVSNSLTFPHPPLFSFLALNVFASISFLHRYVHLTFISFHLFLFPLHFTPPQFPLHCIYFPSFFLCFFFFSSSFLLYQCVHLTFTSFHLPPFLPSVATLHSVSVSLHILLYFFLPF